MEQDMHEDIIDQIESKFEHCRIYGHMWDSKMIEFMGDRTYRDSLRCDHCGTERRDKVSMTTGMTVSRSYSYSPGYKLKKGAGGWDAAARGRLRMRSYEQRPKR